MEDILVMAVERTGVDKVQMSYSAMINMSSPPWILNEEEEEGQVVIPTTQSLQLFISMGSSSIS